MENPDLPNDLLLLILIRLSVNCLLRFKCVSKSWNALISSQYFGKMHLNQSLIHPKPLGLICKEEFRDYECIKRMHIFAFDCSKLDNFPDTIQRLYHLFGAPDWMQSILIGSCHGLLCVTWRSGFGSFCVFNPLTRNGLVFSGETSSWIPTVRTCYYGFGYDDANDDYKVVTWGVCPEQSWDEFDCSKFDVYSVKDGSWSTRVSGLTGFYTDGISCGVLLNSVLHWVWRNSEGTYNIVAFDLRTEKHRLMETPENHLAIPEYHEDAEEYRCKMELGALNGCLCGFVFHYEVPHKLDVWVMKEYGVKGSWIKMTIDMSLDIQFKAALYTKLGSVGPVVPIEHVENKKKMMLYSYEKGFFICDMATNKVSKVIKIPEFVPKRYEGAPISFSAVLKEFCFQGSLVQPSGFGSFRSLWDEQPPPIQLNDVC